MHLILGLVVFLIVAGIVVSLLSKGKETVLSSVARPYIGLLIIAGIIAVMGLVLGLMFKGIEFYFFYAAKALAVLTLVIACLHLIKVIFKRWF